MEQEVSASTAALNPEQQHSSLRASQLVHTGAGLLMVLTQATAHKLDC